MRESPRIGYVLVASSHHQNHQNKAFLQHDRMVNGFNVESQNKKLCLKTMEHVPTQKTMSHTMNSFVKSRNHVSHNEIIF